VPDGTDVSPPDTATTTTMPTIEVIRETGTLRGQGPGRSLIIEFIEQSTTANNLEVGSTVETAGGATGIAPAGLPIGVVSSVEEQSGSPIPVVEVESAAGDLSRLTFVTVLLYLPNPGT
jgi:cell shape-determining protein MreC